ncbi:MAG: penicillin-insensitive murein endopeptidase [bacterium]|nr:penicillin-insensitive murein endopeptidase [bacterium]
MVKGLMAGKMASARFSNAADELFNLPPGYSVNDDINDPNCGLPIDAVEDNIFVNCFEFRIGDEQPEIEFSIEIPEPKEMWPTIPSTGAPNDFDFSQVESSLEEIIVTLKSGGTPLGNTAINVKAEWITESGGHNHQDTVGSGDLITPPNNIMGYLVNIAERDSAQGEIEALTNEETGRLSLRYNAPEFGGQIALVARYIQETDTLFARDTVNILVPNLILLPEGTSYSKVGGTPSHFGPRVDHLHQDFRVPDNNHYGTQELVDFLINLSNVWEAIVLADSTQDNRQTPLNINDMSLPNGGKFDIFGRWTGSHYNHRVGRDVDIRTTRNLPIGNNRNGVLVTALVNELGEPILDDDNFEVFKNLLFEDLLFLLGADNNSSLHGSEANEHYHLYLYNN